MLIRSFVLAAILTASSPVWAQPGRCETVGGMLMTNINAIDGAINLGPVTGDLAGSVAAKILPGQNADGSSNVQHYWVTSAGSTILFKPAALKGTPIPANDPNATLVAVSWGNYVSEISGGTGKFEGATGQLEYFGLADFKQLTLVLRYRGQVCFKQ